VIVVLLLIANTINIGADLGAMGEALTLLIGGSPRLWVVVFAVGCALLETFSRYERYVSYLKWTTLSLFAYVAAAFAVACRGAGGIQRLVPAFSMQKDLCDDRSRSGYHHHALLFFWQSSQEAEDERVDPAAHP